MEVQIKDLLSANESLRLIAKKELPVKCSYRLMRLANKISSELKVFNTNRLELLKKYGEKVKGGFKIKPENSENFEKDIETLLDEKLNLDVEPILLEVFGDIKTSLGDMLGLDKFIRGE
jgi:hypothetical protein